WSLSWMNNPEVKKCYKFLNLLLILPDHQTLSNQVLTKIVNDTNKNIKITLKKDQIDITLTYNS
ncbi:20314_t:CDS:1, partial [Cetraspora pellucida]